MAGRIVNSLIITTEIVLILSIAWAFWFPNPSRVESLLFYIPVIVLRVISKRRLWTPTPLDVWLILLIGLGLLNGIIAPYTWGIYVVGRLVLGALVVMTLVEVGQALGTRRLMQGLLLIGGIVGGVALISQQYTEKSALFAPLLGALPTYRGYPVTGGINVNEAGGVLALIAPLALALAIGERGGWSGVAWGVMLLAWTGLLLGQSRLAIGGAIIGCALVVWLLLGGWARRAGIAALTAIGLFQVALLTGLITPPPGVDLARRDEASLSARLLIWGSAVDILGDHPLSGVGINQFRRREVRVAYPVVGYETAVLPHAHHALLHVGTDMGLPGMIAYSGLVLTSAWLAWRTYRTAAAPLTRLAACGLGAGLLAHSLYGLGDAITLFDRSIVFFWMTIGGIAALDRLRRSDAV